MKKENIFRRIALALSFALALTLLTPAVAPTTVSAATRKVTGNTNYKKAPAVKVGTTKVTCKKQDTYVKFTAPKAATYQISIYNITTLNKPSSYTDYNLANFYIRQKNSSGSYLSSMKVKTQGGKTDWLRMATPTSYERFYKGTKVKVSTYLQKRTVTLKLKKGQVIYVNNNYFTGGKSTYYLQIKKK